MFKRYYIQIWDEGCWRIFYRAKAHYTKRAGMRELDYWNNYEWDFIAEQPRFRLYDFNKDKAVPL